MMRAWLVVVALAACGTKAAPNAAAPKVTDPVVAQAPNECQAIATQIADYALKLNDGPKAADRPTIVGVIVKHCEGDGWTADAKKCLATLTDATADECGKLLTDDQNEKLVGDLASQFPEDGGPGDGAGDGPDAPAPSRGGDPCEGGE